jgi:hypothetical protein
MMAQEQRHDSAVQGGLEASALARPVLRSSKSEGGRAKADAATRHLAAVSADYAPRAAPCADPAGFNPPEMHRNKRNQQGTSLGDIVDIDAECGGDLLERLDGSLSLAGLELRDVRRREAGCLGQFLR